MSDATALSNTLAIFAATYLLHSTLLLAACWLLIKLSQARSHFLVERMWKSAAVLGLATASLQIVVGASSKLEVEQLSSEAVAQIEPSEEQALGTEHSEPSTQHPVLGTETDPELGRIASNSTTTEPATAFESITEQLAVPIEVGSQGSHHSPSDESGVTPDSIGFASPIAKNDSAPSRFHHSESDGYLGEPREAVMPVTDLAPLVRTPTWWDALQAGSPWLVAIVSIGLAGCIIGGGVLLVFQTLRLRTRFATARLLKDGPARRVLDRFLKRHNIRRRIKLLSSTKHNEPITYGLFVWTIVLPEKTGEQLGRDELKALLAHEVAHLVRGDVWWLWIGRVLCTCLAFQPLNWIARRKWQQAAEYLCDDWAVERGVRSISLARCLTQIAEWRFGQQACEVGLAAGGTKATLVQRVERLVEDDRRADVWTKPLRRRLLTLGAAVAVVGLAGFAPRIALPQRSGTRESFESEVSRLPLRDETTTRDWHALEEELLQLETDLERVKELLKPHNTLPLRESGSKARRGSSADGPSPLVPRDPPASGRVGSRSRQPGITTEVLATSATNLNRRAAALRARREHIASLLRKDSER